MAINSFIWNNGTEANPVSLTNEMIDKLISAKGTLGNNIDVSGYYEGDENDDGGEVKRSRIYMLEQAFPNLKFMGASKNDSFNVSFPNRTYNEGSKIEINVNGINPKYLNFECIFGTISDKDEQAPISDSTIKSKFNISVEETISGTKAFLTIANPTENKSWTINVAIGAYPKYYENKNEASNDGGYFLSEEAEFKAIRLQKINIAFNDFAQNIPISTYKELNITKTPNNSTKQININNIGTSTPGFEYRVFDNKPFIKSETVYYSGVRFTCYLNMFNDQDYHSHVSSNELVFTVTNPFYTTIVLDQSNNSIALNTKDGSMFGADALANNIDENNNVFLYIRNRSHLYFGRYDNVNNVMKIRQLNDADKRYYNGVSTSTNLSDSAAYEDITGRNSGTIGDVFLRMPEFWYCTKEVDTDKIEITLSTSDLSDYSENIYYNKWDSRNLIGVYKACIIQENGVNTLHSLSEKDYCDNYSITDLKSYASNRINNISSNKFSIVTYQAHIVMALLYICWYGKVNGVVGLNAQNITSTGTPYYYNNNDDTLKQGKNTGWSDVRGMSDSTQNSIHVNFWGLENWYGGYPEIIDNIITNKNENNVFRILVDGHEPIENVMDNYPAQGTAVCFYKFIFGKYSDLIPKSFSQTGNYIDGFFDGGSISKTSNRYFNRGGLVGAAINIGYSNIAGPFAIGMTTGSASQIENSTNRETTRLMYNGAIEEVDNWD